MSRSPPKETVLRNNKTFQYQEFLPTLRQAVASARRANLISEQESQGISHSIEEIANLEQYIPIEIDLTNRIEEYLESEGFYDESSSQQEEDQNQNPPIEVSPIHNSNNNNNISIPPLDNMQQPMNQVAMENLNQLTEAQQELILTQAAIIQQQRGQQLPQAQPVQQNQPRNQLATLDQMLQQQQTRAILSIAPPITITQPMVTTAAQQQAIQVAQVINIPILQQWRELTAEDIDKRVMYYHNVACVAGRYDILHTLFKLRDQKSKYALLWYKCQLLLLMERMQLLPEEITQCTEIIRSIEQNQRSRNSRGGFRGGFRGNRGNFRGGFTNRNNFHNNQRGNWRHRGQTPQFYPPTRPQQEQQNFQ